MTLRRRWSTAVRLAGLTVGLMLALPATTAHATSDDDLESRNLATVSRGFQAWSDGTGSPYDALADDAAWEITGNSLAARTYDGKEDFLTNVIHPFNARMSQRLIPTVRNMYADGDTVVVVFDAVGAAKDGVAYRNTYSWILQMREDRIVRATAFFDSIAFDDLWRRVTP